DPLAKAADALDPIPGGTLFLGGTPIVTVCSAGVEERNDEGDPRCRGKSDAGNAVRRSLNVDREITAGSYVLALELEQVFEGWVDPNLPLRPTNFWILCFPAGLHQVG